MKNVRICIDLSITSIGKYNDTNRLTNQNYDKGWLLALVADKVDRLNDYWAKMEGVISLVVDDHFEVTYDDNSTITLTSTAKERPYISNWDITHAVKEAAEDCGLVPTILKQLGKATIVYISEVDVYVEDIVEETETEE